MIGLCRHITRKCLSWEMRRGVERTCRAAQVIAELSSSPYSAVSVNGLHNYSLLEVKRMLWKRLRDSIVISAGH
jgi:hypothetical protein